MMNHNRALKDDDMMRAISIDLPELVEKITSDQMFLREIADKDLILFIGTTNAGKTTTICFISGKELKVKQEIMIDPEGKEVIGDEVLDTIEFDAEFRIGHSCDSTTASIHVCYLPDSKVVLADSCGFHDTQGSTVDVANAVILRRAMALCSSLRPVVVIDANVIGVDKGVPFTELLNLLLRFFTPIESFLPSMTFLFTHAAPEATSEIIKKPLTRLAQATHVRSDPNMKSIVDYLYTYVRTHGDRCILKSGDLASPNPHRVSERRIELRNLIEGAPKITQDLISFLGCPISVEAQLSLREECHKIKLSTLYHLSNHHYSSIPESLNRLGVLAESINLSFLQEFLDDCCAELANHFKELYAKVDEDLQEKKFEKLSVSLGRCYEARSLGKYAASVSKEYNNRVMAVGKMMVELSNVLLNKEPTEFDHQDFEAIKLLREMKHHLSFFLIEAQVRSHGYDATLEHLETIFSVVDARCGSLLTSLAQMIRSPSEGIEKDGLAYSHLNELLETHSRHLTPCDLQTENASSLLSYPFLVLHADLAILKSACLLQEFISPKHLTCYAKRLSQLLDAIQIARELLLGEGDGLCSQIQNLHWSLPQSHQLYRLHEILRVLYCFETNDLLADVNLYDLPAVVAEEVQSILSEHLNSVDNSLLQRDYCRMAPPLQICLAIDLNDEGFKSFKTNLVEKKASLVKGSVRTVFEDCHQMLCRLQTTDVIEKTEFENATKLMLLQKHSCQLEEFLYPDEISSDPPCRSPSECFAVLLTIAKSDWSNRISQFLHSLANYEVVSISQTFLRMDWMDSLCDQVSECLEDVQTLGSAIEKSLRHVVKGDFRSMAYINDGLSKNLLQCDALLALSSLLHSSRLLSRQYQDLRGWVNQVVAQLTEWKSGATQTIQEQIKESSASSRDALRVKDGDSLNLHLTILQHHRCFDDYLHPTASTCYDDTRAYLTAELKTLAESAKNSLLRKDLAKYNVIRVFLEASTVYGAHFESVDFQSMVSSMFGDHRRVIDMIPEEIRTLLDSQRFQNIRMKLINVREDDPEIFAECDAILTRYFRKLSEAILSAQAYSPPSTKDPLLLFLGHLETLQDAVVLSGVISYDPVKLLVQIVDILNLQFSNSRKRFLNSLGSFKFILASQIFDQLMRFKILDLPLAELKERLPAGGDFELFDSRVSELIAEEVEHLPSKLLNDCYSNLGISHCDTPDLESKTDEGSQTSQAPAINVSEIGKLCRSVAEASASAEILFQELIDFSAVKTQIGDVVANQISGLLSKIQSSISRLELTQSESLLRTNQMVLSSCGPLLESFLLQELTLQQDIQQRAYVSAIAQVNRPKPLVVVADELTAMSEKLRALRAQDFTAYLAEYNGYCELFYQEAAKCKDKLCSEESERLSASALAGVFDFLLIVPKFKTLIAEPKDHRAQQECTELLGHFDGFMEEYLETAEANLQDETNVRTLQKSLTELSSHLPRLNGETSFSRNQAQWLGRTNDLILQATKILTRIHDDRQALSQVDLFTSEVTQPVLDKLSLLSRNEPVSVPQLARRGRRVADQRTEGSLATVLTQFRDQFSNARKKFCDLLSNQEHQSAARGYHNLCLLSQFEPLRTDCEVLLLELKSTLSTFRRSLLDNLKAEFQGKRFKEVDKLILQAASFDVHFNPLTNTSLDPLMDEVVSLFRQELGLIVSQTSVGSELEDHADNIVLIKTLVTDISSVQIQELAESFIDSYLKNLKSVDFFQFGMKLMELGPLGEEVAEHYPQFKSVLTKRFNETTASISIDHALGSLKAANPAMEEKEVLKLKEVYEQYNAFFEKNLERYLPGYKSFQVQRIDDLIGAIKRKASRCTSPLPADYLELLGGIFSLWTILSSKEVFDATRDRSCLIRPHAVQLIAIFRLLKLDRVDGLLTSAFKWVAGSGDPLYGHLIQVGTGEGKSILLGGLAALLALLGIEVFCASYSKHLSDRDFDSFRPLFDALGVLPEIHYSTLAGLAETVINSKGDIRSATQDLLLSRSQTRKRSKKSDKKRILLIDEVDVFFSPDFFGRTYNPVASLASPETAAIFRFIWSSRHQNLNLRTVQQLPEYQALLASFIAEAGPIVDQHIAYMIEDSKAFDQPAYVIETLGDGTKKIGYKDQDSINTDLHFGYRTAFAYLHEVSRQPALASHVDGALAIQVPCGCYSFAEIPKKAFQCILGVTGTLNSLSPVERQIISNEYQLNNYTFTPSMYGDSKLAFKKNGDVLMETDANRYYQTILKEITDERGKGRPVILYFETEEALHSFRSSEYGQRLDEVNIVTEKTHNVPFYVNKATVARTVTLFTRVFGRGLDFISRDVEVDKAGGVHVIQTFFSEFLSEEIQIRGRTARQSKKGSFKMILLASDLDKLGLTLDELNQSYQSNTFYDALNTKREEKIAASMQELVKQSQQAKVKNDKSKEFRRLLLETSGSRQDIVRAILSFQQWDQGGGNSQPIHSVFCLDESGSMTGSWRGLIEALLKFLEIRREKGGVNDIVSVVQFSTTARLVLNAVSLQDALARVPSLSLQGGGTTFSPALAMAQQALSSRPDMSSVLVFMTDGACSDPGPAVQECHNISQSMAGLQFFGIAFNTSGETLLQMSNAVSGTMVSAANVNDLRDSFQNIARMVSANYTR